MSKHQVIAPPPDGLERALQDAQRRRLQTAGFSSTATALACAAVLALSATGGTDVLGQHPGPASGGGPEMLLPTTLPEEPTTTSHAAEVPAAAGTAAGRTTTGTAPQAGPRVPVRTTAPEAVPSASRAPKTATARPTAPMQRTGGPMTVIDPNGSCAVQDAALCTGVTAYSSEDGLVLSSHLCSHGPRTVLLRYATDLEVDFLVGQPDLPSWRWSAGQSIERRPHLLWLEPGECYQWETIYDVRTSHGTPLPAGPHRLTATFHAEGLGGAARAETTFHVTPGGQSGAAAEVPPPDDDEPIQSVLGLQNSRMPRSESSRP